MSLERLRFLRNCVRPASLGIASAALLAGSVVSALAGPPYGGFYGHYYVPDGTQDYVPDGTQERLSRTIPGAAPTAWATSNGVRCSYMFVVRNGVRERHYICD